MYDCWKAVKPPFVWVDSLLKQVTYSLLLFSTYIFSFCKFTSFLLSNSNSIFVYIVSFCYIVSCNTNKFCLFSLLKKKKLIVLVFHLNSHFFPLCVLTVQNYSFIYVCQSSQAQTFWVYFKMSHLYDFNWFSSFRHENIIWVYYFPLALIKLYVVLWFRLHVL